MNDIQAEPEFWSYQNSLSVSFLQIHHPAPQAEALQSDRNVTLFGSLKMLKTFS